MSRKSILLIGYDSNLSLGVIYCLKSAGYDLFLLTHNPRNAAKYSRFIKNIFYDNSTGIKIDTIINIVKENKVDLIMPFDEMEIRKVNEHKDVLLRYAKCLWTTQQEYFDIGINKGFLAEFLTTNSIPCPKFMFVKKESDLDKGAFEFGFPLLVKPVRNSFGRGIKKIENIENLKLYFSTIVSFNGDTVIQPFIIGNDVTVNVICENGNIICYTLQETPVKYGENFKSDDVLDFHDDDIILAIISKMMKLLRWNGVACIDMRRDSKTSETFVLEINGRFWASMVSSYLKAGVNFPLILAKLSLGDEISIPKQKMASQITLKTYFRKKLSGKKASFHDTKYISYLSDPVARIFQYFG